jgi:hypothetical protein
MRLWIVWAVLAVIWALQAVLAVAVHHQRPAIVMFGMALLFAAVGGVVRQRTRKR